jgi:radical SAM protein with 4Fe4S-binding SPASM domain
MYLLLPARARLALYDFTGVFGRSPKMFPRRLLKAAQVLLGMVRGDDRASSRMPLRVQIEVTDRCNFDCIMCNRLTRPSIDFKLTNDMDAVTFTRLLDEIKPSYVTLNGLGEPALHRHIDQIIGACHDRSIRTQLPSNMSIPKVVLEKIAPNPPTVFTFSMHGATKASFEAISVGGTYESSVALMEAVLAKVDRRKTSIRILCALQAKNLSEHREFYQHLSKWDLLNQFNLLPAVDLVPGQPEERRVMPTAAEVDAATAALDRDIAACGDDDGRAEFYRRWRDVVQALRPAPPPPPDAAVVHTGPCLVPWYSTYITARGKVLPCCYLTDEQHVLGDIHEESFEEIWNGARYRAFRRALRENRGQLPGCRECPANDTPRLRSYNPLSLVSSRWDLDAPATMSVAAHATGPGSGATASPIVSIMVKGKPISTATVTPPDAVPVAG